MKKLFTSLLALTMIFVMSCSALAVQAPESTASPNSDIELYGNSTYWYQNDTINNGKPNNMFYYRLDEDFQYAKIWVKNTSAGSITVTNEYNGKEFGDTYTIAKGADQTIYVKGNGNTGAFYINVNSTKGHTLDGLITVRTGTKAGVGYPW